MYRGIDIGAWRFKAWLAVATSNIMLNALSCFQVHCSAHVSDMLQVGEQELQNKNDCG